MSRGKPGYSGGVECNEPAFMWNILLFLIILYGVILFGSLLGFLPFKSESNDHGTPGLEVENAPESANMCEVSEDTE